MIERVSITKAQRDVHVAAEILGLTVVAPFSFYLATRKTLPAWARAASAGVGLGSLILDGYLLSRYLEEARV